MWCGEWCGVVWRGEVWCGEVWHGEVRCGVVWCGEVDTHSTVIRVHTSRSRNRPFPEHGHFYSHIKTEIMSQNYCYHSNKPL